ncbi:UDP-2,4-diacetamido-2,4,6-trideoxy-beta-L-altropyranose hydrolase [Alteromonas sp. H39]|uniref:UDP-2,4-diacetamido-2,4, 6-trideoxy-beta-L-altropyranose hydrolase n=1 Tax=Alteromonas sp. H39 TaxID=3389876 RepID=UPI0039E0C011
MTDILLWAEGGRQKGIGHVIRSLALAQAADEYNLSCRFLLDSDAADIARAQHDWNFPVEVMDQAGFAATSAGRCNVLVAALEKFKPRVLVLDGYQLPVDVINDAASELPFTVVMDDGEQRLIKHANLIVNSATDAMDASYHSIKPDATLCTGRRYRLLRQAFRDNADKPLEQRHGIVMAFGGSDPAEMTIPLLSALEALGSTVPVRVITGPAFNDPARVNTLCRTLQFAVQHIHQCQDMASAWSSARLAISAAGGSQFELGACCTPSVLVMVAENQREATTRAQQEGWCVAYDMNTDVFEIARHAMTLYQDNDALEAMSRAARQFYDAEGARRVVERMLEALND